MSTTSAPGGGHSGEQTREPGAARAPSSPPPDKCGDPLLFRIADALGRLSSRFVPSAFSIAILLTVLTIALATLWASASLAQVVKGWGDGFWELLTFSMQMSLVMFTGYLLALTRPVRRLLEAVASLAGTPGKAVLLTALASMLLAYVNWGLSLIASALLVRFVVRRQPAVDYRLLVCAAYFGLGTSWHAGLSASAPLLVATPGHFLQGIAGIIPIDQTIFAPFNLLLVATVTLVLPLFAWALHPSPARAVRVAPELLEQFGSYAPPAPPSQRTFANWLDHGFLLNGVFGAMGIAFLLPQLAGGGWRNLNINTVNLLFLTAAILLHRTPAALLKASEEAASVLHGIVLQFPLYAGIYGIFKSTGLTERIGEAFVAVSTAKTFPAVVYWYSGIVNYFVPSGGSKWAIEAPYLLKAAGELGVPASKVVLAYGWGDMATNLIQPFWALPLVAVARVEFRELLGFLLLVTLVYVPLVSLAFLFFA